MDYSQFKTPLKGNNEIKGYADRLRAKFWNKEIPVDVEKILERNLKITIIPLKNANRDLGFESFITSNWENVFVDEEQYLSDVGYRRVRFSLAHELGHLVLHRELYESLGLKTLEDYYEFRDKVPGDQYGYLETQANKFAGYLLVPREELTKKKVEVLRGKMKLLIGTPFEGREDMAVEYIYDDLAEIFNVSSQTIEICLKSWR